LHLPVLTLAASLGSCSPDPRPRHLWNQASMATSTKKRATEGLENQDMEDSAPELDLEAILAKSKSDILAAATELLSTQLGSTTKAIKEHLEQKTARYEAKFAEHDNAIALL